MRRPGNRGHQAHGWWGTKNHLHNRRSPSCAARGTGRGGRWPRPPQPATEEERVHPSAATSQTRVGMQDGPPPGAQESEDILKSIFNMTARTAGQGLQTDEHLHDDESFPAFMASCQDRALMTGRATTSALRHTAQNREPASPRRDPAFVFHQAHLRRNYAALGPPAAVHATTAGDGHAGGQCVQVASQHPRAQDRPTHEVRTPAAAGTVCVQTERMPPRVADLGDRRAWTLHNPKGLPSAPARRQR